MATATLILNRKRRYDDGAILELRLWQVPAAVPGSSRLFKYSLFYGSGGQRLVAYDNEAGKGDHRHHGDRDREEGYAFTTFRHMLADFLTGVRQLRGGEL